VPKPAVAAGLVGLAYLCRDVDGASVSGKELILNMGGEAPPE
jgi:hypothetical protein